MKATNTTMATSFFGKQIKDWEDIYVLLVFRGATPLSFKDLMAWEPPSSPQECINLAFELCEARAAGYENPVRQWVENILMNQYE